MREEKRARAGAAGIKAERLQAAALWATLEGTPAALRLQPIEGDARYHIWALAARFLEAAAEYDWLDTARGLEACTLALAIAERLPEEEYPDGLGQDLRGRALGCMAEALRLVQQPEAARATLAMAWEALDEGTADPLERAGLLRVQASLEMSLGYYGSRDSTLALGLLGLLSL